MQSASVSYFILDAFWGEAIIPYPVAPPSSIAYFCGTCGEIWARISSTAESWQLYQIPCERHEAKHVVDTFSTPGSLLHPFMYSHLAGYAFKAASLEHLPRRVLEREFMIYLNKFERSYE